jgi:hypothetical protein
MTVAVDRSYTDKNGDDAKYELSETERVTRLENRIKELEAENYKLASTRLLDIFRLNLALMDKATEWDVRRYLSSIDGKDFRHIRTV